MRIEMLEKFLLEEGIPFELNVDLRKKTWIHRGGNADYYITPIDTIDLEKIITFLYHNGIQYLLVGGTSNLYILNSTSIPIVVSTLKCKTVYLKEGVLECDCGVQVSKLAQQMIEEEIKGFEYLTQLPGTIGGAICNNSSVKNQSNSITELLIDFDIITPEGLKKLTAKDLNLTFRSSDLKKHILQGVILKARLRAERGDIVEMKQIAKANEEERYRILEGPAKNLGCTVHRMFCNGHMPSKYSVPLKLYSWVLSLVIKDKIIMKKKAKRFLLTISGHRHLIPYVSDKQLITFIWKDENADSYFEEYLTFMQEVCMTDQVEIEIIK